MMDLSLNDKGPILVRGISDPSDGQNARRDSIWIVEHVHPATHIALLSPIAVEHFNDWLSSLSAQVRAALRARTKSPRSELTA